MKRIRLTTEGTVLGGVVWEDPSSQEGTSEQNLNMAQSRDGNGKLGDNLVVTERD